jgi:poly-gamma-glutamate synthesis protein (capsule biosynthesis protein)
VLAGADIAFCNLECPLSARGRPAQKKYVFRAPASTAESLRAAGIDLVSLANNHSLDYGRQALKDTLEALRAEGISWVGAGEDLGQARQARNFSFSSGRKEPIRVTFLAYSNMRPIEFYATARRAGTVPAWESLIKKDVAEASRQADFTIVSFHWGKERSPFPTAVQRTLARLAIDSGADLVLGHHPHVLQGVERYRGGIIAYSLGNFVFPSRDQARESVILRVRMQRPKAMSIEILPVLIEGFTPQLARGPEAAKLLKRLAALSARLGTELELREDSAWLRGGDK